MSPISCDNICLISPQSLSCYVKLTHYSGLSVEYTTDIILPGSSHCLLASSPWSGPWVQLGNRGSCPVWTFTTWFTKHFHLATTSSFGPSVVDAAHQYIWLHMLDIHDFRAKQVRSLLAASSFFRNPRKQTSTLQWNIKPDIFFYYPGDKAQTSSPSLIYHLHICIINGRMVRGYI